MRRRTVRPGFTLIELLVVLGILLVLAGITVVFLPDIAKWQRASEGASQVQLWLRTAQQLALRDKAPRGLRLNVTLDDVQNPTYVYVTDLQYIGQLDDLTGGNVSAINGTTVTFTGVDFTGGSSDQTLWLVQPNDYLEIKGGGLVARITAVTANSLTLASTPTPVATPTWQYRVIRQPRVLPGEEALQLPQNVAIDLKLSRPAWANGSPLKYIDVLFSPDGKVIGSLAAYETLALWVRDTTLDTTDGDQTLLAVYTRTGLTASYPVDTANPSTPYSYLDQARPAGP